MTRRVLVTGASGFVGRAVVAHFLAQGWAVRASSRSPVLDWPVGVEASHIGDTLDAQAWRAGVAGVDSVVHCAARVHVLREQAADPLGDFRQANVQATQALAQAALNAGVRRFVFVSSVGVNGAQTGERPFRADDPPAPHSPYAQSKLEAERALRALTQGQALQAVVVRPPLVYGPGAPGNFARMLAALRRGLPLPLGAIDNRRSLVAIDNLTSLLHACATHPQAVGNTFMVSDGEDLSTTQLLQRLGQALGRPARLIPVPATLLRAAAAMLGRSDLARQLTGSLQVDISATRQLLGWSPPQSLDAALRQAVGAVR